MTVAVDTLPATLTLRAAVAFLTSPAADHPSFPVVDVNNRVVGVVDPPSILRWRRAGAHRAATLAELLKGDEIATAYPDEYLEALADRLSEANVAHLPVISREDGSLVGYVGWKDLMRVRAKRRKEETQRAKFFWIRTGPSKHVLPPPS